MVEGIPSTLKHELALNDGCRDPERVPQQLIRKLVYCIGGYCSRERHRSMTGRLSPITCNQNNINTLRLHNVEPQHLTTELGQTQDYL